MRAARLAHTNVNYAVSRFTPNMHHRFTPNMRQQLTPKLYHSRVAELL